MPLSTIIQLYCGGQFIGGGNRRTQRKPSTYRKSLANFITYCCTLYFLDFSLICEWINNNWIICIWICMIFLIQNIWMDRWFVLSKYMNYESNCFILHQLIRVKMCFIFLFYFFFFFFWFVTVLIKKIEL
jgi:hypothetical protein